MPLKDPEAAKEYQRAYAAANAERKREAAWQWRQDNPERSRESRRRYVEDHREEVREDSKRRHAANRDELNAGRRARRLRPGGKTPKERRRDELITILWAEQGGRCYLCEELIELENAALDHDHRCCPLGKFCRYCVRGAACQNCNKMIGHAADTPERLERAARNLRAKLAEIDERMAAKPQQFRLEEPA